MQAALLINLLELIVHQIIEMWKLTYFWRHNFYTFANLRETIYTVLYGGSDDQTLAIISCRGVLFTWLSKMDVTRKSLKPFQLNSLRACSCARVTKFTEIGRPIWIIELLDIIILISCGVAFNLSSLRFILLSYFRIFHCGLLESDLVAKNSALEMGMMESAIVIYNWGATPDDLKCHWFIKCLRYQCPVLSETNTVYIRVQAVIITTLSWCFWSLSLLPITYGYCPRSFARVLYELKTHINYFSYYATPPNIWYLGKNTRVQSLVLNADKKKKLSSYEILMVEHARWYWWPKQIPSTLQDFF